MYEEALAKELSNCLLKPTLVLSKIILQKESESFEGLKVLYWPSEYDKAVDDFFNEKTNYLIKENGGKVIFDPVTYLEWIIQSEFLEKIGEDYGEFTELFKFKELLKWYDEKRKLKFSIYYSTEKACSDYEVKIESDKKPTTVILHFNILKLNGTIETAAKILAFIQILKDRNIPPHILINEPIKVEGKSPEDTNPPDKAIDKLEWNSSRENLVTLFTNMSTTKQRKHFSFDWDSLIEPFIDANFILKTESNDRGSEEGQDIIIKYSGTDAELVRLFYFLCTNNIGSSQDTFISFNKNGVAKFISKSFYSTKTKKLIDLKSVTRAWERTDKKYKKLLSQMLVDDANHDSFITNLCGNMIA